MSLASGKTAVLSLTLRYLEKKTKLCYSLSATWHNPTSGSGKQKHHPLPVRKSVTLVRMTPPGPARLPRAAAGIFWRIRFRLSLRLSSAGRNCKRKNLFKKKHAKLAHVARL